MDRTYDIVVFGATGFTGRLLAEYFARKKAPKKWALAGRDKAKLDAVRLELAAIDPALASLPILVADSGRDADMATLAASTKVVATTVGPFAKYGRALARACAEAGTHCADITGETTFIRKSIDENHAKAEKTGAKIVHCCGFDSIPSDLGVFVLAEEAKRLGHSLGWVKGYVHRAKGGFSGGTAQSAMLLLEEAASDPSVRRLVGDPYALDPAGPSNRRGERGPDGRDAVGVGFDRDIGWTAPFVMAAVNTRVVRRSNALLGHAYGPGFRYSEVMGFSPSLKGLLLAGTTTTVLGAALGALHVSPVRTLIAKHLLPKSGQGPSKESQEKGFFDFRLVAETAAGGERGVKLRARVAGPGDPGYKATAAMLGESSLCLAEDDLGARGGVLTPATALGNKLVHRLRAIGFTVEAGPG